MESKELLIATVCLIVLVAEIGVQAMSAVNTDFERYLRTMNSSTTVPKIEERNENFIFAYLNYTYGEDKYKNYTEEKARYGEGQILNVQGMLVHVTNKLKPGDDRACSPNITGTLGNPLPRDQPWIALVRRGECNFEDKVRIVYEHGAVGVIIFNDKLVANLEKMQIRDKNRNITAVITYKDVGEEMAAILDQGYEVVIAAITRGRSGVRPVNTLNKTSVLFVSISFIVLMIISLVWLIFYYIQRFRYLQSKDQQSRHLCSVTKRAIMKIPTKTGKGNDKDSDNDCCAICIEVYKSSDCIRVLPCNHEFHKACIDPWLIEHRTCPMCKLDVLKYYGYVVCEPSAAVPPANERIINPNVHIVIAPSSTNSSQFGNDSSNHSTDSSGSSQPANVDTPPTSPPPTSDNSSLMLGGNVNSSSAAGAVVTASTASRQVTDV